MVQEAAQEIDMEVFSRRIGPYFSWLESKIESGWIQSDHIVKDVLKETKYLATTMRARFILGVIKPDFIKEVERTLELFELASDAFPNESDEIDTKVKHFIKGISEELGPDFVPAQKSETEVIINVEEPVQTINVKVEPKVKPEIKINSESKKVEHVQKVKVEKVQKIEKVKPVKKVKKAKKAVKKVKAPEVKTEVKSEIKLDKPKKSKKFSLIRWLKEAFYGEDLD